jgi:serine O-acetyltransferase
VNKKLNNLILKWSSLLESDIPPAYQIYFESREAYKRGEYELAEKTKRLNYLLHNSEVPYTAIIGKNTVFAYGGIGVIIHSSAQIGERANIGSCVTVAGSIDGVPVIGDDVYLSTGSKILGNVKIGHGCIIGANSVVREDVSNFQVVAGVPARVIGVVNRSNFAKYAGFYWCKGSEDKIKLFLDWYFPESIN